MIKKQDYRDIDTASKALSEKLVDTLQEAINSRGKASLVVSGGNTPKYVFQHLSTQDLDWSKVIITLTDERWVSASDPDSNEKLAYDYLMKGAIKASTFISFFGGEATPEKGQLACEMRLSKIIQPFDAVYLGLGDDGHFASLFPNSEALDVSDGLCVAISETKTRLSRMSLTVDTILQSRNIFLLFSGSEKHEVYAKAQKECSYKEIPLRLLLSQEQLPLSVLTAP